MAVNPWPEEHDQIPGIDGVQADRAQFAVAEHRVHNVLAVHLQLCQSDGGSLNHRVLVVRLDHAGGFAPFEVHVEVAHPGRREGDHLRVRPHPPAALDPLSARESRLLEDLIDVNALPNRRHAVIGNHDKGITPEVEGSSELADGVVGDHERLPDHLLRPCRSADGVVLLARVDEEEQVLELVDDRLVEHQQVEWLVGHGDFLARVEELREAACLGQVVGKSEAVLAGGGTRERLLVTRPRPEPGRRLELFAKLPGVGLGGEERAAVDLHRREVGRQILKEAPGAHRAGPAVRVRDSNAQREPVAWMDASDRIGGGIAAVLDRQGVVVGLAVVTAVESHQSKAGAGRNARGVEGDGERRAARR